MVTLPLDVDDLLAQSPGELQATSETIAPGTSVGHVHLKVADVPRAVAFYRETVGLEEQAQLPSAAFLSAGGYHHHIGVNSWQSRGASAAPPSAPGLRESASRSATAIGRRSSTPTGPASRSAEQRRADPRSAERHARGRPRRGGPAGPGRRGAAVSWRPDRAARAPRRRARARPRRPARPPARASVALAIGASTVGRARSQASATGATATP